MIVSSTILFWTILEISKMSFFQKLLKRKPKRDVNQYSPSVTDCLNREENGVFTSSSEKKSNFYSRRKLMETQMAERMIRRRENNAKESTDSDDDSDETSEDFDDRMAENRKRKLKSQIYKLRRQREKLRRRQTDALAMEQEIREVMSLIRITKQQTEALKEDVLNKKCEMKFLATEVPEGYEMEARKKEPVFYKKYNNVKSASEANNLLTNLRQKIKALQYIELLTYNKYLEHKHDVKSCSVKHRSGALSKNKKRHFGPLKDAIQFGSAGKGCNSEANSADQEADDIPLHAFATVTIESPTPPQQSTPSTPPMQAPAPLLPAQLFRGPLSLVSSANMATETFI
ncbi:uncharacterized protein DDB_G0284459-like [Mercenaria mercenaria]|uniref:uncharacterized protein DDB_G0284459-like n=1 Tax=Mercenaria mercenaria TaxID=6596 RepID=UPI00234EC739|nr:uncharacterized protein DDB_G0284459-like [Mercenaria mercenaria]